MELDHLRVVSLNSKGHAIDRIEYMKHLMLNNDVIFLQEHWYVSSELKQLESMLINAQVIGISGMNENTLLYGRPYGGCAIIYNKQLKCTITPVSYDSKRCMANVVSINGFELLFVNVYMPCDVRHSQLDTGFDDVLNDINMLISNHSAINHIIIGGDFNTDLSRTQSPHTIALHDFCEQEVLSMCVNHPQSNIDFTYESSTGSKSVIDHFMVSQNLSDSILSYQVLHDGDNLSDHSALVLCLDISIQYHASEQERSNQFCPHPLWRRATDEQLCNYRDTLNVLLNTIPLPEQLLHCENMICEIHRGDTSKYYDAIIKACVQATELCIPSSSSF